MGEKFCAEKPGIVGCLQAPCCKEETAQCLSCALGHTVEEFCALKPGTVGCPEAGCCTEETADCLSCAVGKTLAEFCADRPSTVGCAHVVVQTKQRVFASCPPPEPDFHLPHKGCGADGDDSACVANNEHFSTLSEAWEACGRFPECGIITKSIDGMYYLRRSSD